MSCPVCSGGVQAETLRARLQAEVDAATQVEVAEKYGLSPSYLHDILRGKRGVGWIARKWGYREEVWYVQ